MKIKPREESPSKQVFAYFTYQGTPYFVLVREATGEQQQLAREYLSKTIPNAYYDNMIFVSWSDTAPDYHKLYPETGSTKESLTRFLADLSSKEEVIKHALR